jgi:hypothetical protein
MLLRIRLLTAISLAVIPLAPMAHSAIPIGKIQIDEHDQVGFDAEVGSFGSHTFSRFKFVQPQSFYLCETGVDPNTPTKCEGNLASDLITVTNSKDGAAEVSMISDLETVSPLPPGFPMPPEGSPVTSAKEAAKQRLSPDGGLATVLNFDGSPGPKIRLTVKADLDPPNSAKVSDILFIAQE